MLRRRIGVKGEEVGHDVSADITKVPSLADSLACWASFVKEIRQRIVSRFESSAGLQSLPQAKPKVGLARWINALDLRAGDRAYHLGCGVGYYTAIMAEVVGPGGSVVGSEVQSDLAARAQANLSGYRNVTVHAGDGAQFDPGPCDAMLINARVTHPHPLWLELLREGGRLVVPITLTVPANPSVGMGLMEKITRRGGVFLPELVSSVAVSSCTNARDPQLEPLLTKAVSSGALLKLKSVRVDVHEPDDTCAVHASKVCLSTTDPAASPR